MKFIGIKELSQHVSKYVDLKDWVVVTRNGRPKKVMIEVPEDELEDMILGRYFHLEEELQNAGRDLRAGRLPTLDELLHRGRKKKAA